MLRPSFINLGSAPPSIADGSRFADGSYLCRGSLVARISSRGRKSALERYVDRALLNTCFKWPIDRDVGGV
jgi:hypothetical protein